MKQEPFFDMIDDPDKISKPLPTKEPGLASLKEAEDDGNCEVEGKQEDKRFPYPMVLCIVRSAACSSSSRTEARSPPR